MKNCLRNIYDNPSVGGVFYSANGALTGSARLNAMPNWDWTPVRTNWAGGGVTTCMFAQAMGCEPDMLDGKPWIKKLIHDPAQVQDIGIPDIYDGWPGNVLCSMIEQLSSLSIGELIRCPDIQSPLGIAELMWDDSFYTAFYEYPDAIHSLLNKITQYQIAYIKEFNRLIGSRLNPCGFPCIWAEGEGAMIADDTMSLLSPMMHAEFSVPYINRIADACGPIYYHSCTWNEKYFENIHSIRNVKSYNWNPGDSIDFGIIAREFGGKALITPHLVIDMHREKGALAWGKSFADEFEFFRYLVESTPEDAAIYFWFSNIVQKGDIIERIYDYLHDRGSTPQARGFAV
ncbi:MAG: uroporphyrinogen decarboxylase family protein [bacterium]